MKFWSVNFFCGALDVGLDVELDIIVAQAVGEALCHNVCRVQSNLVAACDVVVNHNREGNADCTQLFHCLFLVLCCFFCIQSDWGFAVFFWQTQLCSYQLNIVFSVGGVAQTLGAVEVVFTVHWFDWVGSLEVINQVQTIVPGFAECFIGYCLVPVFIRCTVFIVFIIVETNLTGIDFVSLWNQLVVELMIWVVVDGHHVAFAEVYAVHFTILIHLVNNIVGLYHFVGDSIKAFALGIPVFRVLGEDFFVALNIRGHGVASVVPHGLVVHGFNAVYAQFIDHCLCSRVHTCPGCHRIKVWLMCCTGVDDGAWVRSFNADHLLELGVFVSGQFVCFFFGQRFGPLIVFFCTGNHFTWLCRMGSIVFVIVQYPLHTGCKVVRGNIGFFFAVHVHPFDSVADVELPVQTVVLGSPFICNTSDYFTFGINFQQWVLQVGQNIQLREILAVQNIKGFHLRSGNPAQYQVLDFLRFCFFLRLFFLFLALCCCGFAVFSRFFCRGATAAAAQQKSCCQHHGKHFG